VICPGFGNAVVDYITPLGASEEIGFKSVLERRGFKVEIVPVERYDWIRVAGGLLDPAFYAGNQLPTGRAYGWYLTRIQTLVENCGDDRVLLVAHSAGGWLARAALGSEGIEGVCGLVTLGSPHFSPPDGINCATRGALENTDAAYPGAFLDTIPYITVAGNAITVGNDDHDSNSRVADKVYEKRGEGNAQNVAKVNYQAIAGECDGISGDGVIPISAAHLQGAEQITLDGVLHSINEAGTTLPTERWYGSEKVVDQWLSVAMKKINNNNNNMAFSASSPVDWFASLLNNNQ